MSVLQLIREKILQVVGLIVLQVELRVCITVVIQIYLLVAPLGDLTQQILGCVLNIAVTQ
jgi:hypothetical protein